MAALLSRRYDASLGTILPVAAESQTWMPRLRCAASSAACEVLWPKLSRHVRVCLLAGAGCTQHHECTRRAWRRQLACSLHAVNYAIDRREMCRDSDS